MQVVRMCISCFTASEIGELWRFVLESNGIVQFDFSSKKNGRGAYICKKKICAEQAIYKKAFTRAFKKQILGVGIPSGENTRT